MKTKSVQMYKVILTIATFFLFGCQKSYQCHSITEFLENKPTYEGAKMVTYGKANCDMFTVTVEYFNGTKKEILMDFNHRIINEQ